MDIPKTRKQTSAEALHRGRQDSSRKKWTSFGPSSSVIIRTVLQSKVEVVRKIASTYYLSYLRVEMLGGGGVEWWAVLKCAMTSCKLSKLHHPMESYRSNNTHKNHHHNTATKLDFPPHSHPPSDTIFRKEEFLGRASNSSSSSTGMRSEHVTNRTLRILLEWSEPDDRLRLLLNRPLFCLRRNFGQI